MTEQVTSAYVDRVFDAEMAAVRNAPSSGHGALYEAAKALGKLIDVPGANVSVTDVESSLESVAVENTAKYGRAETLRVIRGGIAKGRRRPRDIVVVENTGGMSAEQIAAAHESMVQAMEDVKRRVQKAAEIAALPEPKRSGIPIPNRMVTDENGEEIKFCFIGKTSPKKYDDDVRRHTYKRDNENVFVKTLKQKDGRRHWNSAYRVRDPATGKTGWQYKKPNDFVDLPYVVDGAPDPFESPEAMVVWAEGEKDVETLAANGIMGFTFGGTEQVPDMRELLAGHQDVVVAIDADAPGEAGAARKIAAIQAAGVTSIRVIRFTELGKVGADISDYFERGGTVDSFEAKISNAGDPAPAMAFAEEGVPAAEMPSDDDARAAGANEDPEAPIPVEPIPVEPVKAASNGTKLHPAIARMNTEYAVVRDGGRTRVVWFEEVEQGKTVRQAASFGSFDDIRNFHLNEPIALGDSTVPLGHWWLKHPGRRTYRGLVFQPGGGADVGNKLNLWRGWGIEPAPGQWPLMRDHIRTVLAAGDESSDEYIIRWCAWALQHPDDRAQAAVVFKGKKGVGKGTLCNALAAIFGQHAVHASSVEHVSGKFNSHLRDVCFLFADEAYFPGDKGAEGSLKRLITEPTLLIEPKGRDAVTVKNMLHVAFASNENWVVPAGENERRYAVFNVSDVHMQDRTYFDAIYAEQATGGLAAMVYDLMAMDLGDFRPSSDIPETKALLEQQQRGLGPEDSWWVELLETGVIWGADEARPSTAVSNDWEREVQSTFGSRLVRRKGLFTQAREISPRLKGMSDHFLGNYLRSMGASNVRKIMRRQGWTFPNLLDARAAWEKRFKGWAWRDPHLAAWQFDGADKVESDPRPPVFPAEPISASSREPVFLDEDENAFEAFGRENIIARVQVN